MSPLRKARPTVFALLWVTGGAATAFAQASSQSVEDRLSKLEIATTGAQSAGDNAWMLVCAALVLMMTGPGLALFYGGLGRRKKVPAPMMQSFILMAILT